MKQKPTKADGLSERRRLAAIASPLRMEIIGALRTHGPRSIRELASQLDRPADGLYHHVRTLVKADIVVERQHRKVGRRTEAVYELTAERIAGRVDAKSAESKAAAVRAGSAVLRLAHREFKTAIETDALTPTRGLPNIRASRQKVWLTDKGLVELHRLLRQVERLLTADSNPKRGRPHALTIVLAPCVQRRVFRHGAR